MEAGGWIITNIATIVIFFMVIGYYKGKVDSVVKDNDSLNKKLDEYHSKMETQNETIVEIKNAQKFAISAKEVDDKYLSKEVFRQFVDHMKTRFDGVEKGLDKILAYIKG